MENNKKQIIMSVRTIQKIKICVKVTSRDLFDVICEIECPKLFVKMSFKTLEIVFGNYNLIL